jgi:choline kinase
MKAILLAAGRGSRLQQLTANRPKCLVEFNGRPLVEHTIQSLRLGGISEVGIVAGYRREMLEVYADVMFVNERWESTGIFHSLSQAAEWLERESCIVSYSDIFYPPELVEDMIHSHGDIAVAYDPQAVALWERRFDDPLSDMEQFVLGSGQSIEVIGGRAANLAQVQGQYMGLLRLTPEGWNALSEQQRRLEDAKRDTVDMTSLLSNAMQNGVRLQGVPTHGPWGEIDCPSDIQLYQTMYPNL